MTFASNAHTHTTYCDGKNAPAELLRAAKALGFVSLGFSGHAWQGFDPDYCMSEGGQADYFASLRRMQAEQAAQAPRIYVGLEQDMLVPPAEKARQRAASDYIIGSCHYLPVGTVETPPAVDGDPEQLQSAIADYFGGDPLAMAAMYYQVLAEGLETAPPDVIGHFDLVRKYAGRIGLDTADERYREMALAALCRARATGAVLEVNTGAIARGYAATPYPDAFLLAAWRELGGEVTLTSDCHDARFLDCAFDSAAALLRETGFRSALRLSGAPGALWESVAL